MTGLPVDFQLQRLSDANKLVSGPRDPLGIFAHDPEDGVTPKITMAPRLESPCRT